MGGTPLPMHPCPPPPPAPTETATEAPSLGPACAAGHHTTGAPKLIHQGNAVVPGAAAVLLNIT